jgi:inner membrane protease ATP23
MEEMGKLGCMVDPVQFFSCKQCPMAVEGFYDKNLGVVICENNISPKVDKLTKTLLHESIHAFDYCNTKLDGDDCLHVACTEIRANNLSGQCEYNEEIKRGNLKFFRQKPLCIKRRAELSLQFMPQCKDVSRSSVERAFRTCFQDNSPFPTFPTDTRS